jgi:hypothetical protein
MLTEQVNNYDFVLAMPNKFEGRSQTYKDKHRQCQLELISILRKEHLVCRILKSRDEVLTLLVLLVQKYKY